MLADVWGFSTRRREARLTLSVGWDYVAGSNFHVYEISSTGVHDTLGWIMDRAPLSIWFTGTSPIYVAGNGVWNYQNGLWNEVLPQNYVNRVRGTGDNNVFAAGYEFIAHYNGSRWVEYPEARVFGGTIVGLSVIPSMVVAVGASGQEAIVVTGYPQ